jgi:trans-aconitate 2-methyltransferase
MNTTPFADSGRSALSDWDAALYLKFENERLQPARDLLARVEVASARAIVDLGCGPGTSVGLLAARYPDAAIIGVDSSAAMLATARKRLPAVTFEKLDIGAWRPKDAQDVIFANAALEWLPDHSTLLPRLFSYLAPGGALAIQMPDNRQEASHVAMRMIAADGPWTPRLLPIAKTRAVLDDYSDYHRWLRPIAHRVDIWQTTYIHALGGVDDIIDWFRGSALRPYLDALDDCEREEFLTRYRRQLEDAYPREPDGGVLFPYPRLFILARKAP